MTLIIGIALAIWFFTWEPKEDDIPPAMEFKD